MIAFPITVKALAPPFVIANAQMLGYGGLLILILYQGQLELPAGWPTTVNSISLLGLGILGAWTTYQSAKRDKEIASVKKTGEAIHTLSNSAMGAQLKKNVQFAQANATLAHRMAEITKESADIAAAIAADIVVKQEQELLQVHLIQQAIVDAETPR